MSVIVILMIIALVAWAVFLQIQARKQVDIATSLSEQDAAQVVTDYFGVLWTQVGGAGHLNYRPKLRVGAPTISISFAPSGTTACEVSIWTSHFHTRYGLMSHAQLAWRKKRALAGRLGETSAASGSWGRGA